ncbi:MAG: class I SAM-dependent methyltransferase [Actinobacteria bacterium]|nr:class I SAM-dependent methyltransferase [Actinomycetota bacterium]
MSSSELSDHAALNRTLWTRVNAEYTAEHASEAWAREEVEWGMFSVPERAVQVLGDVAGKDVVELGCGTAYFSAWLARLGARPVGVDVTPAQLETARRCQEQFGLRFPLIEADAEDVPLPDGAFDLVLSEYGASIWCDPYRWVPEAARLLRPGGELVFLRNSTLAILCSPHEGSVGEQLVRPQFPMHRFEWSETEGDSVEFHLSHGDWIRLLRESGFEIEALYELQAAADARSHAYYDFVSAEWARRWPAEEIWKAKKRA